MGIGERAVFARRHGAEWYIAALNGAQARTIGIDTSFLGPGAWTALVARDQSDDPAVMESTSMDYERSAGCKPEQRRRTAGAGQTAMTPTSITLTWLDWLLMVVYFGFVIGVGVALKRTTTTSKDFFQAGRALPAWICGLAFLSANLGAQEIIGMAASGAKYGIATSHFYWVGAIPAMVFLAIFMMPFYYGSRARSVPEYLRLRFDEKTRAFNAMSFALMTVFSSGISMYAMAKLLQILHIFDGPFASLGIDQQYIFHVCIVASALVVLVYVFMGGLSSAIYNEVLQFFLIVAGFIPLVLPRPARRGRVAHDGAQPSAGVHARLDRARLGFDEPDGSGCVRRRHGPGFCAVVRLLVYGLSRRPARNGRRFDGGSATHAAHRGGAKDVVPVSGGVTRPHRTIRATG